ncbi:MAG: 1-acyl-sn-glycerol-3-phosphate acyltransferase [Pigmentiphaga sp.]|nr:1-acyl-sn-glycerol-3-phosphate acyltransferase [Pigmentiphaga sp.]
MARLRSAVYLLFLIVTVIPYAFACLACAPLPQPWRYRFTVGWPRLAVLGARAICGIRWEVRGWENLPDAPAVVLAKHQSAWETLWLPAYMPRQLCFIYKRELHRVPFFGWGLALLDMIAIDRSDRRGAMEQVFQLGSKKMAEGRWPILFPEGTRVAPGQVGRYQAGGARLAAQAGVPVIPIAHNAGEFWPRNAFIKRPGLITVSIGPPIDSAGLSATALNAKVQEWIEGEMRRLSPHRYG